MGADKDNKHSIGDVLRERGKSQGSEDSDIGDIWGEQVKKEKQRKRLLKEYELNKNKSKQLRKDIIKEYADPSEIEGKIVELVEKIKLSFFSVLGKIRRYKYKKSFVGIVVIAVFIIAISNNGQSNTSTLGESVDSSQSSEPPDDNRLDSKPDFELLTPSSKDQNDLEDVTRRTPDGSIIYTFQDLLADTRIEVTQQQLPETFKTNQVSELAEFAAASYLPDVISIDDTLVYHGVNEDSGVQSLIFVKKELLVFIRSDRVLSDNLWVSYYLSLN